jgi:hypothetical protein
MILDDRSILPGSRTTSVTLAIKPVEPPSTLPTDGNIDGNVYQYSATTNTGAAASINPKVPAFVELRMTGRPGSHVVEQYSGGRWVRRKAQLSLNALYVSSNVRTLGHFALVIPGKAIQPLSTSKPWMILALVGGIIVLLPVIGLVTLQRRRQGQARSRATGKRRR